MSDSISSTLDEAIEEEPAVASGSAKAGIWSLAAIVWLVVVVAVAVHQWRFWQEARLNTDVMALLPVDEQNPQVLAATRTLAERVSRQVVVVVGAPDWPAAQAAAAAWRQAMEAAHAPLRPSQAAGPDGLAAALEFYRPWRDRLLTPAQREQLARSTTPALVQESLAALYQPGAAPRLVQWASDPLGLWRQWWAERAAQSRARPRDGALWLAGEGLEWEVMSYETTGPAFALDGTAAYGDALRTARDAALKAQPKARILEAGLPLHAEAAAVQANREVNTIGWGSLAAVLLLMWMAFRSVRPMFLVALSLAIGTATALSVTAWLFGDVHLLTLVFGATLVGVAEDYGIHYFASRQGHPQAAPRHLMRRLLPGLALALATSVVAYLVLGLAPFPGLRQMAVFSATGLLAAFLTSVCWFPFLDRGMVPRSRFAHWVGTSLRRMPVLEPSPRTAATALTAGVLCLVGAMQLHAVDDIRQLQNSPAPLVKNQLDVGRLIGVPSVAQFYLVQGGDAQEVLEREESLRQRLDVLIAEGRLGGYSAISDWVPSLARQQADAQMTARVEPAVLAGVGAALGEKFVRPAFSETPLTVQAWLVHPVSTAMRGQWLPPAEGSWASVVLLRGVQDVSQLPALAAVPEGLDGVRWVDKAGEVSSLLGRYRVSMTWLLVAGYLAVLGALLSRYGTSGWRALAPTAIASLATMAVLGWTGQPFQLFHVLALVLLLGIGVDYGIFLLEHPQDGSAWLAVVLGAGSTWLAFGLLGLSSTPALRAFGLTLLVGIALVWILSPWLCAGSGRAAATEGP